MVSSGIISMTNITDIISTIGYPLRSRPRFIDASTLVQATLRIVSVTDRSMTQIAICTAFVAIDELIFSIFPGPRRYPESESIPFRPRIHVVVGV
jgi:hypothetical protein